MGERGCWIGVAAKDYVLVGKAGGFCMFAHGKHTAARRLGPGDRFAYYSPMTGMAAGQVVRAFTAIGEIAEAEPEAHAMGAAGTGWGRAARYFEAHDADIYPLLPQLAFVTDPAHWGMYFRRSLFKIGAADFRLIAEAMGAHQALTGD